MDFKKLPIYYSLLQKRKRETESIKDNIIYVESIKGYSSNFTMCFSSDKPISKLLRR